MPKKKKQILGADCCDQQEQPLLQKCPLASAILENDLASIQKVLEQSLPNTTRNGAASVEDVDLKKSLGEAFTGGRSTPVYSIAATVHRNGSRKSRHFIAKLVMMDDNDDDDDKERAKVAQLRESYAVERRFYDTIALQLGRRQQPKQLTIPRMLHSDLDGSKAWPIFCILMNDVTITHPEHPIFLHVNQAKAALKWIASFHAMFWGTPPQQQQKDWRLWDRGGFWTKTSDTSRIGANWLQTIRYIEAKYGDALTTSTPSGNLRTFGKRLQTAGKEIHECLNKLAASSHLGTIIHGDYKAANMFLSTNCAGKENTSQEEGNESSDDVAVVDFQYTGFGLCSDDVAYLLYPDARGHFRNEDQDDLINCYHSELIEQLMIHGKGGPSTLPLETFLNMFRLSQLEMTRHWLQKGWAASTPAEVELMLKLDSFITTHQLDDGEVASSNLMLELLRS